MKIKTNYNGCPYITPGKEYEATVLHSAYNKNSRVFSITDDNGRRTILAEKNSAHLDGQSWKVINE